ncbi:hypothetical protein HYE55_04415 [Aggregatibacter actinomycetemcomitans]|uniref:hypothetical protein n=1 Tax=Aggregatibacter actinomycetemcomitans TaxID=714 RepID=UPI00197B53A6|nr:hypothetical protein [Aggregatibacter actinomycetemcomitans]MBN6081320.1 hypothetical protein [Aggregatibacter actinomycetemcomitans]
MSSFTPFFCNLYCRNYSIFRVDIDVFRLKINEKVNTTNNEKLFFAENDITSKDLLYLSLQNTNHLEQIKLYGSYRNGDFEISFNPRLETAIRAELGIEGGGGWPFNLDNFFEELNRNIPQHLPAQAQIATLRRYYPNIRTRIPKVVNDEDKIYRMGFMRPKNGAPREQTLRKLYNPYSVRSSADRPFIGSHKTLWIDVKMDR